MMMVTFNLDDEKKVTGIEFSMTNNHPQLDLLKKKFISDFNLIMLTEQSNDWLYQSKTDQQYSIVITDFEPNSDRKRMDVTISRV